MIPHCPQHGDTMMSMESIGAPNWYTCTRPNELGMPCGKSAHGGEQPSREQALLTQNGIRAALAEVKEHVEQMEPCTKAEAPHGCCMCSVRIIAAIEGALK